MEEGKYNYLYMIAVDNMGEVHTLKSRVKSYDKETILVEEWEGNMNLPTRLFYNQQYLLIPRKSIKNCVFNIRMFGFKRSKLVWAWQNKFEEFEKECLILKRKIRRIKQAAIFDEDIDNLI